MINMINIKQYKYPLALGGILGSIFALIWIKSDPPQLRVAKMYLGRNIEYKNWWDNWYASGGTSGSGSYGKLAEFKADVINDFISSHNVKTVVEFGCGDGNQLSYMHYPKYIGLDVSPLAVQICREKFANDSTKQFMVYNPKTHNTLPRADLVVCLDVLYHITDDKEFHNTISDMFNCANKYIILYTIVQNKSYNNPIIRYRNIIEYINHNYSGWQMSFIPNEYPGSSPSDFIILEK